MKRLLLTGFLLVLLIYAIPLVRQNFFIGSSVSAAQTGQADQTAESGDSGDSSETLSVAVSATTAILRPEITHTITVLHDGQAIEMDLEDYVAGVVAAEVPASFPPEALRAQAVAARTYAVCKMNGGRTAVHENADVCDDFHHCAAYVDLATDAVARWGENAGTYSNAIRQAVRDTAGQIVTYQNKPIVAVFHSASAGKTEAAKDVWGSDVPYLQSVDSPGSDACPKYKTDASFTVDEFRKIVAQNWTAAKLTGKPASWLKIETKSQNGAVLTATLGGVTVKGGEVRDAFSLRSPNFTVTATSKAITFHTIGYGHGVGLSQYGAKYMAEQGKTYEEILKHYYIGTEITKL